MAQEHYPSNNDILLQSIGSAITIKAAEDIAKVDDTIKEALESTKKALKLNFKKTQGFRNKSYSVTNDPKYQQIKDKFGKAI
jgi:hypothetical protein